MTIAHEIDAIEERTARLDRVAGMARHALHPAALASGFALLLTIRRWRGTRLIGRVFLLATTARRLVQTIRMLESAWARRRSRVNGSPR